MKTAIAQFWGNKTARYSVYNGKLARLANVYSNNISYIFDKYSNLNTQVSGVKSKKVYTSKIQWIKDTITTKLEWLRPEEYIDAYNNLYA